MSGTRRVFVVVLGYLVSHILAVPFDPILVFFGGFRHLADLADTDGVQLMDANCQAFELML